MGWNWKRKNTDVKFIVETDTEINRKYCPDINYKNTRKLFNMELVAGKVLNVRVPLESVRTLIISAVPSGVNVNGRARYLFPNVVIVEPNLIK